MIISNLTGTDLFVGLIVWEPVSMEVSGVRFGVTGGRPVGNPPPMPKSEVRQPLPWSVAAGQPKDKIGIQTVEALLGYFSKHETICGLVVGYVTPPYGMLGVGKVLLTDAAIAAITRRGQDTDPGLKFFKDYGDVLKREAGVLCQVFDPKFAGPVADQLRDIDFREYARSLVTPPPPPKLTPPVPPASPVKWAVTTMTFDYTYWEGVALRKETYTLRMPVELYETWIPDPGQDPISGKERVRINPPRTFEEAMTTAKRLAFTTGSAIAQYKRNSTVTVLTDTIRVNVKLGG